MMQRDMGTSVEGCDAANESGIPQFGISPNDWAGSAWFTIRRVVINEVVEGRIFSDPLGYPMGTG